MHFSFYNIAITSQSNKVKVNSNLPPVNNLEKRCNLCFYTAQQANNP